MERELSTRDSESYDLLCLQPGWLFLVVCKAPHTQNLVGGWSMGQVMTYFGAHLDPGIFNTLFHMTRYGMCFIFWFISLHLLNLGGKI